jgi:acetylornithine deacetylase/succinyl-diaminopimelate desuccinylase-like protein
MNRQAIHSYIDAHLDEHIENIRRWVRQKSASWDYVGLRECAELVAKTFRDLGCKEVEILEGRFHPGVWAVYDTGKKLSVHDYCYFDTATAGREGWKCDPWAAELMPMGSFPKVLMGRGAWSGKGPYVSWLNALSSVIAVEGTLPMNIMFLLEGEDLMGSPSYRDFVERKRDNLKHVSATFCPNPAQSPDGSVAVGLGMKGLIIIELVCSAASWGFGPKKTIFSGAASLVDSPAFHLIQALATMTDGDGRGCKVKGLEDLLIFRKPLTTEEQQLINGLVTRFKGVDWRDVMLGGANNVDHIVGGTEGAKPLINWLYGGTFTINGLYSGFLGPRTNTDPFIVPNEARAMIEMRLVVEMPPEKAISFIRKHLDSHGFTDIKIEVYSAFSHTNTPPSHPAIQAALKTLADWRKEPVVWPMQAIGGARAAVPMAFGVPCIRGSSLGHGRGSLTDINEYMVIEGDGKVAGLADVEKYYVDLLYNVAASLKPK